MNYRRIRFFSILMIFLNVVFLFGCSKDPELTVGPKDSVTFMVLSDIHYFDPSLFTLPANTYLQSYIASDRKMIVESSAILQSALAVVEAKKPDFLLITGDLTKDGEKANHQILAKLFKSLSDKGIKVLVIPGNHDVYNPYSASFLQSTFKSVDNVNPDDFASIYKNCGYSGAVQRDANSLSYVYEPVAGLWILAIDACHYWPVIETAGSIPEGTLSWIRSVMAEAKNRDKLVVAMMHHGLMEHFTNQNTLFPGYVINDWKNSSSKLSDLGIQVIFTGHFHAHDIVKKSAGTGGFIFDVETNSLVTWPSAYRTVTVDRIGRRMKIETGVLTDVTFSTIPKGMAFQSYSLDLLSNAIKDILYSTLAAPPYSIPGTTIKNYGLDRIFANAVFAHFGGDEMPSATDLADLQLVKMTSPALGEVLQNIWTDLPPADKSITLDLVKGTETGN